LHLATGRSRAASPGSFGVRRTWSQRLLAVALALAAVAGAPAAAAAHGGEGPALEAFPGEARAGETVTVVGDDLEPLGPVSLVMLTAEGSLPILDAETDQEGHFTQSFVVPELPERVYELVVTDAAAGTASTFLLVGASETAASTESWFTSTSGLLAIAAVAVLVVGALVVAFRAPRPKHRTGRRG
jgi:hypothetical protein